MAQLIFINLPVADVEASVAFYEAIGARKDPRFSQTGMAASMVLSETIHVMLLSHAFFATFTDKRIVDARTEAQALFCFSEDDRAAVDRVVEAAGAAGGRKDPSPAHEYGHMYGRAFEDLDGHAWQAMWMDVDAFVAEQAAAQLATAV